jgi:hypothetical protein
MWRYLAFKIRKGNYRMEHKAPGPDNSPLYDVTLNGTYPSDFYDSIQKAAKYYGDGNGMDLSSVSIIFSCRGKPSCKVTVYRAIPNNLDSKDKIKKYEKELKEILNRGKMPSTADYPNMDVQEYYEYAKSKIEELKNLSQTEKRTTINPGDWVTINRTYAILHGKGVLDKQYRIVQKTVPASTLFTDGNSIHEWGYYP